jgi:multidrug efflux pump subunit AcrA (membrane-fusion protein)
LVVEVTNSQGEYAQMGQTLLKVVSDKKKFVEVDVDEKYYTTINKGNQVRLITEDASSSVKGIVSFIAPSVNQENGTVSITVEIIESLDMFIENMTVQVDFVTTSIDDAIVISGQYLENDQELYVYTYLGNGQVEKRAVEVFNQNSSQIYITKGLEGNEELVLPEEVEDKDLEIMDKGSES